MVNFSFCFWVFVFGFFSVDHFLGVFIEFVTMLFLLHVLVFWPQGMEILAPWQGIETVPLALEGKALTTGPPVKVKVQVTQSCPTLCDPMDYIVHGIL